MVSRWILAGALLAVAACQPDAGPTGPEPGPDRPTPELLKTALKLTIDLRTGTVTSAPGAASSRPDSRAGDPSLALVGRNEIMVTASNLSRSVIGLNKVRIRFDVAVTNRLAHGDLVTPTWPAPPSGVTGVLLFPFRTVALGANGQPLPLAELRATPSADWDGAPHNFFNSVTCGPLLGDDCFRWESFGSPVAAGTSTAARQVGFDVDPHVVSLEVYALLAADISDRVAAGSVAGTVSSALFGPLAGVVVAAMPGGRTATTDAAGGYQIAGLAPGGYSVALSGAPSSCFRSAPLAVTVQAGAATAADFPVTCRRVAFSRFVPGIGYQVHVINADGTGDTPVTSGPLGASDPSWSPDGSRLAFTRAGEIWAADADGSDAVQLTSGANAGRPAWSPDGSRIAYVAFAAGRTDLWVMASDGSGETNLTSTAAISESEPAWSPDGLRLLFTRAGDIWVMAAMPGSAPVKLTANPFADGDPDWSPDGTRIVYSAAAEADDGEGSSDDSYEIWVMSADGSSPTQLTDNDAPDWEPAWSPDGSRIVWSGLRPGTPELFTMSASGGPETPLTVAGVNGTSEGADW